LNTVCIDAAVHGRAGRTLVRVRFSAFRAREKFHFVRASFFGQQLQGFTVFYFLK